MNVFGESITCPHCKDDFIKMFPKYKNAHPEWNTSRYNLFLAIVRMHNTVNKKLDKPSPKTVAEALELLRNATSITKPSEFRQKYIDHVMKFWNSMRNNYSVISSVRSSQEMNKINLEYWNLRESSYEDLPEAEIFDISYQYSNQPDLSLTMHKGSISRFLKRIKMIR
jgi:hypothetical protein